MSITILYSFTKEVFSLHNFVEFDLLVNIVTFERISVASNYRYDLETICILILRK
jgi:hypothetical protein